MKVLLDECLPKRLTRALAPPDTKLAQQVGWSGIKNGRLLALATPRPKITAIPATTRSI
jgi:hypothetical protein